MRTRKIIITSSIWSFRPDSKQIIVKLTKEDYERLTESWSNDVIIHLKWR